MLTAFTHIRLNEAIALKDTPSLEMTLLGSLTYYIARRNNTARQVQHFA